jgi:transposase-like protein
VPAWPHRLDDTDGIYIRVKGRWTYLYRAVDGRGRTIDFLPSAERDKKATTCFFRQALGRGDTRNPREVVTDRLKSHPGALREMKREGEPWRFTRHRRGRWHDNRVEQDHRRVKRPTRPMLGFQSFRTAKRTLAGVEAIAMLATNLLTSHLTVPAPSLSRQRVGHIPRGLVRARCAPWRGMACRRSGPLYARS